MSEALSVPVPKYKIGDTVYRGDTSKVVHKHPCPDCLGAMKWKVIMPSGHEAETNCLRCSEGYHNTNLPTLKYEVHVPVTKSLLITGIDLNAGRPVEYASRIDGGSWYTLRENDPDWPIWATEAEAYSYAEAKAASKNAEAQATPEAIDKKRFSDLTWEDARFDQFKNGMWDAWYGYRRARERMMELVNEEHISANDMKESLEEFGRWDDSQYGRLPQLENVVRAAEAMVAEQGDIMSVACDALQKALEALPQFQHRVLMGERPKLDEQPF